MLGSNHLGVLVKAIWKCKAPMKACFLAWAASKGKVPSEIILKKRNFNFASRCAMCLEEEESVDHLCLLSLGLFTFVFGSFFDGGKLGSTF